MQLINRLSRESVLRRVRVSRGARSWLSITLAVLLGCGPKLVASSPINLSPVASAVASSPPVAPLYVLREPPVDTDASAGRHLTLQPQLGSAATMVSLAELIDAAVTNDPRIRAAFGQVLRARADRLQAGLLDNPNLSLGSSLNPYPGHAFTPTRQGGPPQLDIGINYSLERLLFGQRRAGMRAADRRIEAALAAYANVARERMLEAISAYVDVLEAKELARLSRDEVEQLERLEGITARRVALGSVGHVEVNRVHIAVIGGRRRELVARVNQENALTRLRARLGATYMRRTVDVSADLTVSPTHPPPFEDLLERAMRLRPDLAEQQRRVAAAQAAERFARRSALPRVNVGVGYTRQFQERAIGFPNANSWGASLQTSVPAFDRNQGGIAAAGAAAFEAEAELGALRLEVYAELEQALRSLRAAEEILATFDADAMGAAESARDTIEEAYALGGRSLLELLDAQRVYRDVYREHVVARADYVRALHRLNAIVGEEVVR